MKSATQTLPASSRLPNGWPRWSVSVNAGRPPEHRRRRGQPPRHRAVDRHAEQHAHQRRPHERLLDQARGEGRAGRGGERRRVRGSRHAPGQRSLCRYSVGKLPDASRRDLRRGLALPRCAAAGGRSPTPPASRPRSRRRAAAARPRPAGPRPAPRSARPAAERRPSDRARAASRCAPCRRDSRSRARRRPARTRPRSPGSGGPTSRTGGGGIGASPANVPDHHVGAVGRGQQLAVAAPAQRARLQRRPRQHRVLALREAPEVNVVVLAARRDDAAVRAPGEAQHRSLARAGGAGARPSSDR